MKPRKIFSKVLDVLIVLCLLTFFASLGFRDSRTGGWYQQFFPNMNGSTITSLTFLDSLTGYATTNPGSSIYCYILKTTNGGDNWVINYTYNSGTNITFTKIQFANNNIGFASTNYFDFFKTTNGGLNWIDLPYMPTSANDMAVINIDTILTVSSSGFDGGVYRTTNGGLNWSPLGPTGGSGQPSSIYMFNKDIGFCLGGQMRKTTNGGVNWFVIPGESYQDIKFFDTSRGWKTHGSNIIGITTNGGLNWSSQLLPNINHAYSGESLSIISRDTVWIVGNEYYFGLLYKTINGGINWGYQFADTSIHITLDHFVNFVNNKIGWAYSNYYNSGVHTISGGSDTTFYTGINNITQNSPKNFELKQNYPNPYNNSTLIDYYINEPGWVKLKIFDITGREMGMLVNEVQITGGYGIPVSLQLSSGVYFYKLIYTNKEGELQTETKKMMIIK